MEREIHLKETEKINKEESRNILIREEIEKQEKEGFKFAASSPKYFPGKSEMKEITLYFSKKEPV